MADGVAGSKVSFDHVIAHIEACRAQPGLGIELVRYLDEVSACYTGRGSGEVDRLRGYLLAVFSECGLPAEALPFVVEELETGSDPYTIAGAARALRGCPSSDVPAFVTDLLLSALRRIKSRDRRVSFERYSTDADLSGSTTALIEIIRTIAWLGPAATPASDCLEQWLEEPIGAFSDAVRTEMSAAVQTLSAFPAPRSVSCCSGDQDDVETSALSEVEAEIWSTDMQDQSGSTFPLGTLVLGRPCVLGFFYTRCMNPEKCSLTITRLAALQSLLLEQDLEDHCTIAAITYDPGFDLPERLAAYGSDRGMQFCDRVRLMRTVGPFEPLIEALNLGVGYGPATVNRHRTDLMVFDKSGRNVFARRRRSWEPQDILAILNGLGTPAAGTHQSGRKQI